MEQARKMVVAISLLLMLASPVLAGQVKVITGPSTPVDTIEASLVKKIFLGKTKSLPDGSSVEFVVLSSGPAHETFLKQYIRKSPSQFKTYWKKQVFTGKGKSPKSFASQEELVAYVAGKSGVIGYISADTDAAGTKVISEK